MVLVDANASEADGAGGLNERTFLFAELTQSNINGVAVDVLVALHPASVGIGLRVAEARGDEELLAERGLKRLIAVEHFAVDVFEVDFGSAIGHVVHGGRLLRLLHRLSKKPSPRTELAEVVILANCSAIFMSAPGRAR